MIGDSGSGGKWWGRRTKGKGSKRERKIRMGKCWLVKDTSEYASPFVLSLASSSVLLLLLWGFHGDVHQTG